VNVEVVHWPEDEQRVAEMRTRGIPRLLVVTNGDIPDAPDCLEDWMTVHASDVEREARRRSLARRAIAHGVAPSLDTDGLLHHRDHWVSLSPVEQSLAAALLDRYGAVVARETLAVRAWPEGLPTRNALDVHVLRLRRRIAPLGLEIRTVRSRGYLLQAASNGNRHAH
jgi:two-component system, OmpR family, response regulator